jgi:hypothetical protein
LAMVLQNWEYQLLCVWCAWASHKTQLMRSVPVCKFAFVSVWGNQWDISVSNNVLVQVWAVCIHEHG